jgi:hypothetical protein
MHGRSGGFAGTEIRNRLLARGKEREMINSVYGIVMAGILLFPWSLVVVMVGGSAWQKARAQRSRLTDSWQAAVRKRESSAAGLVPEGASVAGAASCR